MSIKLTALDLEFWRRTLKGHYGNAADEIDFIIDAALSQTAPSAQEGAWDALARIRRMPHAQECHRNGNTERVCTCHCVVAEAAMCSLSATPSASALGEDVRKAATYAIQMLRHAYPKGSSAADELEAALADTAGKKEPKP